jgi:hypothetical protein
LALLEIETKAKPFVEMLTDHLVGIAQVQQTVSNKVDALFVWGFSIPLAIITRKPVREHRNSLREVRLGENYNVLR